MEIARLEVSMQHHLDRMQETAKVNYVQYGKSTKAKKGKKPQSGAGASGHSAGAGGHRGSKPSGKGKKSPLPPDTCYRCGKGRHPKAQNCKDVDATCRGCGKKGHYEKVCLKGKCSTHSLEAPQASTSSAGAGASEPLYFNDEGQPVYTYMVSVPHVNKHLIKFPIALEHSTLRKNNADSPQSVLLKADTGADVNLMNRKTFNQLFGEAKEVLKLTPIKMENYGNTAVKVLGMFHAFLRWKDKVYKQLFYMTDCDRSLNLLSRDACYILGVLKPCYTVENSSSPTVNASKKGDVVAKSFLHQKMNGSEVKLSNNSNKWSINKSQLQGGPLTKHDILDIYSDVFTGIGKFQGMPYKFQLKQIQSPPDMHLGKCLYIYKMPSTKRSGI